VARTVVEVDGQPRLLYQKWTVTTACHIENGPVLEPLLKDLHRPPTLPPSPFPAPSPPSSSPSPSLGQIECEVPKQGKPGDHVTLTINVPEYGPVKLDAVIPEGKRPGEKFLVRRPLANLIRV